MKKYHYTYRILNIVNLMEYIGVRSCKIKPEDDIGTKYFSSSTDKDFIQEQKEHPWRFEYKIISCHPTRKSAVNEEIQLHNFFDIAKNPMYYNRAKQTSEGFDRTGVSPSKESIEKGIITKRENGNHIPSAETKNKISLSLKDRDVTWGSKISEGKLKSDYKATDKQKLKMSNGQKNAYKNGRKKARLCGKDNPSSIGVIIYNNSDEIMYRCNGSFKKTCKENGLPFVSL